LINGNAIECIFIHSLIVTTTTGTAGVEILKTSQKKHRPVRLQEPPKGKERNSPSIPSICSRLVSAAFSTLSSSTNTPAGGSADGEDLSLLAWMCRE